MSKIGSSKQKNHGRRSEAKQYQDRISNLPDSVLAYILSFLPMDDAVLTGILSKRWDHLWTNVQRLSYDGPCGKITNFGEEIERFVNFISHTVSLIVGSMIDEFLLTFPLHESSPLKITNEEKKTKRIIASKADSCIRFTIQRKAKIVFLCFIPDVEDAHPNSAHYTLPSYFYSNDSIQDLRLDYCKFDHHKPIIWKSLRKIQLYRIELGDEVMESILTGSPLLQHLYLWECTGLNTLSVNSRKLEELIVALYSGSKLRVTGSYMHRITIGGDLSGFDLAALASVVRIGVMGLGTIDDASEFTMNRLVVDYIARAQYTTFNNRSLQVFSALKLKDHHIPSLSCIGLRLITNLSKWDLPGVVVLLRASANLQILVVRVHDNDTPHLSHDFFPKYDFDEADYWTTLLQPPLLTNLRTVKIYGFKGKTSETSFLEFLLKSAKSLQNMEIFCKKNCDFSTKDSRLAENDMLKFMQMLFSVRRASPVAIVSFP